MNGSDMEDEQESEDPPRNVFADLEHPPVKEAVAAAGSTDAALY